MTTDEQKRQPKQPHWYRIYTGQCPACGAHKGYRERVYGTRPEKWEDRHVFLSDYAAYDQCIW